MRITIFDPQRRRDVAAADLPGLLKSEAGPIWVDMTGPTEGDVQILRDVFNFHPLAIEDTLKQRQRPKVEQYEDHLFIILNPVSSDQKRPSSRELDVFVGRNFIVTVHPRDEPIIDEADKRIGRGGSAPPISTGYLLYVLIDAVVDGYFPILDMVGEEIDQLGDLVLTKPSRESLNHLFRLKRTLLGVWKVVGPQRDMFNILTRRDLTFIDQSSLQYYLRDVYDHLLRITDMIDTYRDMLTSTIDLYMSAVSNRLNQVVNRLTVFTVVIGIFSAITGFYGMNFEHNWPPFSSPWGVSFALGLMASLTGTLLILFRRVGWY